MRRITDTASPDSAPDLIAAETKAMKALADPTRLRLAALLAPGVETCVCDLAAALSEPEFKVSRHLSVLRNGGLVVARREGTWMYYRLDPPDTPFFSHLRRLVDRGLSGHVLARADRERLAEVRRLKCAEKSC